MWARRINDLLRRLPAWPLYPLGTVPFAFLIWQVAAGNLGPDPLKAIEHRLGDLGLQFLLAGLCVTPLRDLTGIVLIRYRRALGLLCFAYASLHLATWMFLDLQLRWSEIGADLTKRPYIILGMVGFAALVPLAITSNNLSVRKLGPLRWKRLQRLAYLAAFAIALHYLILAKAWTAKPMLYFAAAMLLLALRVVKVRSKAPAAAR
ncbi:MAG: protein-methionine-sulfoxide reductase heme-binding subunit MsrQ [Pseudorhodobacter sp.]|nr:protein-methionine-sulfoxide reductase heme-binding subunit MsrQ [Pseudorhodobacter sp.]